MKIYHNPHCKKSRAGLAYLEEKTNDFKLINYIKEGISKEELEEIISKTGLSAEALIRKQEEAYKNDIKDKNLSDTELIMAIAENPKLLKRPIIIKDEKAVWADPPENLNKIL
ncbi:MAG: arsenate reductase (glutaredoxin) [Bacteroidales bacterium]|nr:arsenate reductase (glutaredoxin) [Bacteroidales bacterium]HOI32379.1 arsenate reductase (glutaredoxin) [Bacteroidales bacterium]